MNVPFARFKGLTGGTLRLFQAVLLKQFFDFVCGNGRAFRFVVKVEEIDFGFIYGYNHVESNDPSSTTLSFTLGVIRMRILRRPPPKSVPR